MKTWFKFIIINMAKWYHSLKNITRWNEIKPTLSDTYSPVIFPAFFVHSSNFSNTSLTYSGPFMEPQTPPPSPPCAVPSLYQLPVMLFQLTALSMNTDILTVYINFNTASFNFTKMIKDLPIIEYYL